MDDAYQRVIQAAIEELSILVKTLNKALAKAPEGSLHLMKSNKSIQYVHYNENDHSRVYIPKKNIRLIKALMQKDYDSKLLKTAREQLKILEKCAEKTGPKLLVKVYDKLPDARKLLINDRGISDEEFVKRWAAEPYKHKPMDEHMAEFMTNRGERVKRL